ncbi:hypothetical protein CMV_015549, partial [Castanea mollissima]
RCLGGSAAPFYLAMDECPLSLPENSPPMPNDDEDDKDYNLSDFFESNDDINEDFGMEDDGINRAIGGKQLEGVWNGEGDSDYVDSDELRSAEGSSDDEGNSRPRFPEFNQRIGMENVQLVKDQKFESHVVFKEALKEWCIKEIHDFEYKYNDKWRVTAVCKKKCGWKIHASQTQMGDAFQIKSFKSIRTCGKDHKNSKISSRWLANKYLLFFRDDHTRTANALKGAVFRDHEVDVTLD